MPMNRFIILLAAVLMTACNPTAKLPNIQTQADAAFNQADYNKAYTLYKEYINVAKANQVNIDQALYVKQAQSCAQLNKIDEASAIYDNLLTNDANIKYISEYAQMLQSNGKVDEELSLWTKHKNKLKEANLLKLSTERIISLNAAKSQHQAVVDTYAEKGNVNLSKETQLTYIKALKALKKGHAAIKSCNLLLKEYPNYIGALEWKAKYYYDKAEKRYKYEMNKYNKKKNATTYAYLRRDLKKISADFRIARDTFIKLRKQDPKNKSYIKYLKNAYLRLEQKAEAAKMDKLLK